MLENTVNQLVEGYTLIGDAVATLLMMLVAEASLNNMLVRARCHNSFYDVNYGELRRKISILKGPYTRYSKRDDELFFDLTEKYYECVSCGQEVSVLDIQTLIANLSARLPPEDARRFTMKMMAKYRMNSESIREAVPILLDDFELSKDEPCVF